MSPADLKRFLARPGYAIAGGSRDSVAETLVAAKSKSAKKSKGPSSVPTVDPLVAAFFAQNGIPPATPEYRFAAPRRWRFDYCWIDHKIALEVEGAVWTQGRHTRGSGFVGDMEKYNRAVCLGFRIVRVTPNNLMTAATADMLRGMFAAAAL